MYNANQMGTGYINTTNQNQYQQHPSASPSATAAHYNNLVESCNQQNIHLHHHHHVITPIIATSNTTVLSSNSYNMPKPTQEASGGMSNQAIASSTAHSNPPVNSELPGI